VPDRYLEDRDDAVAFDLDLGNGGLDGGLALAGCAVAQDVAEAGADGVDFLRAGWGGLGADRFCQVAFAVRELGGFGLEVADALAERLGVEGVVFEGGLVAGDGGVGGGELLSDAGGVKSHRVPKSQAVPSQGK